MKRIEMSFINGCVTKFDYEENVWVSIKNQIYSNEEFIHFQNFIAKKDKITVIKVIDKV